MLFTGVNRLMGGQCGRFDGHAHVFHTGLPMIAGRRYTPDRDALPGDLAGLLRQHGLDGAILVQPSFLGTDNGFLLETLAIRAPIFRGVVMLDPDTSAAEIAELTTRGVIGMRLNLVGGFAQGFDVALWDGLLRRIDDAGWHVELHCEGPMLPPVLEALLGRCRTVVIDHLGLPDAAAPLDCVGHRAIIGAQARRVMVKVSGPYRVFPQISSQEAEVRCRPILDSLSDALGTESLIAGSDWPWTRFEGRHRYADTLAWFGQAEAVAGTD